MRPLADASPDRRSTTPDPAPMRAVDVAVGDLDPGFLARWRELAAAALEPNPFFEPAMAVAAARHLAGGVEDRLVVVEDGDALAAVLPVRTRPSYRRVPVRALQAWGHQHAYLDTPLVAPRAPERALGAALDHLRERRHEAWLILPTIAADGPVRAALSAALGERGLRGVPVLPFERPVIHRRAEPTYLDGRFPARRRKELRRQRRRLSAAIGHEVATVDLAAGGDVDAALDELFRLEASGWKGRAGTALASHPGDAAFFRDAIGSFAREGRARLWALRGGDTVAAMACGVVAGDTLFHLKIGHDERLARASPGTLLELDLIDAFHAEGGVTRLDPCTPAGPSPSDRLYPDRRPMHTLLVPLTRVRGAAAAHAVRGALATRAGMHRLRQGATA